jgi:DNA (cytosine-5)-methyltransferase 1
LRPTFVDLYAGCGGLSLGLMRAGWLGIFALEREPNAFSTLSYNLITHGPFRFTWPRWLPRRPVSLEAVLQSHEKNLRSLSGKITLLAGGPPCQGFSTLGGRAENDPRNRAFRSYMKAVQILRPKLVLIENVQGITFPFRKAKPYDRERDRPRSYADLIISLLEQQEYRVWTQTIFARDYGVPQSRPRFILIAKHNSTKDNDSFCPFTTLQKLRHDFLDQRNLKTPVSAKQALGDLETEGLVLRQCVDSPTHRQGGYGVPTSDYQKLMHYQVNGALADSHRLVNHKPETVEKFRWFLNACPKGKIIHADERGKYRTNKHTIYILSPELPAPTVSTLPDDILHYSEPRTLTVREMARLQSFPDWFEFKGKYTTGARMRTKECPRYTQVGNAVPPLLAEAIGTALLRTGHERCPTLPGP